MTWRGKSREYWHPMDLQAFSWPQPRAIVLQDRSTETLYLLTHDISGDSILLGTPVPSRARTRPEEPTLRAPLGLLRLYVEDGVLHYEVVDEQNTGELGDPGLRDEPLFTLNYSNRRTTYEIHASGVAEFGDPLCLRRWDGLGRVTTITDLGCDFVVEIVDVVVFEDGVFEEGVFE